MSSTSTSSSTGSPSTLRTLPTSAYVDTHIVEMYRKVAEEARRVDKVKRDLEKEILKVEEQLARHYGQNEALTYEVNARKRLRDELKETITRVYPDVRVDTPPPAAKSSATESSAKRAKANSRREDDDDPEEINATPDSPEGPLDDEEVMRAVQDRHAKDNMTNEEKDAMFEEVFETAYAKRKYSWLGDLFKRRKDRPVETVEEEVRNHGRMRGRPGHCRICLKRIAVGEFYGLASFKCGIHRLCEACLDYSTARFEYECPCAVLRTTACQS